MMGIQGLYKTKKSWYFELFQILGAFKYYKVTRKQIGKYFSSIKAQKLKITKKP